MREPRFSVSTMKATTTRPTMAPISRVRTKSAVSSCCGPRNGSAQVLRTPQKPVLREVDEGMSGRHFHHTVGRFVLALTGARKRVCVSRKVHHELDVCQVGEAVKLPLRPEVNNCAPRS